LPSPGRGGWERAPVGPGIGRRLAGAWEVVRPFSFTASVPPVSVGGAIALSQGRMHWPLFVAALLGALGLHIGTNVINEIYDVRHGIDSITSPRMSMAILKGRISERGAFVVAWSGFILALWMGMFLVRDRGWPIVLLGLIGFIGGYFYTAPPFQYKYRALGRPLVFILMGPLMVVGSYFAVTGTFDPNLLIVSLPVGLLVTAILHGNEWRDVAEDTRHGFTTFSAQVGREAAHWVYVMLVLGAYVAVGLAVLASDGPRGRRPGRLRAGDRTGDATGTGPTSGFCDRAWVSGRAVCDLPGRRPDGAAHHAGRRSRYCRHLRPADAGSTLRHRHHAGLRHRARRGTVLAGPGAARSDATLRSHPRHADRVIDLWRHPPRV